MKNMLKVKHNCYIRTKERTRDLMSALSVSYAFSATKACTPRPQNIHNATFASHR
jgi:hypothetical protein